MTAYRTEVCHPRRTIENRPLITLLSQFATPIPALPRLAKRVVAVAVDARLYVLTVWLAFYLRLGEFEPLWGAPVWAV